MPKKRENITSKRLVRQLGVPTALFIFALLVVFGVEVFIFFARERPEALEQPKNILFSANREMVGFFESLEHDGRTAADSAAQDLSFGKETRFFLQSTVRDNSAILRLTFFDETGDEIASFIEPTLRNVLEEERNGRYYFTTAKSKQNNYLSSAQFSTFDTPLATWTFPVIDSLGAMRGAMNATIDVSALWAVISNYRETTPAELYIVDEFGALLVSHDFSDVEKQQSLLSIEGVRSFLGGEREVVEYEGLSGAPVAGVAEEILPTGWHLVVEVPLSVLLKDAEQRATLFFSLGGLLFILFIFQIYQFNRFLIKPLASLTQNAIRVAKGDLFKRSKVFYDDEVGKLTETFNDMLDNIESARVDLKISEESYRNIYNNSPESIILLTNMGEIIDVNQRSLDWLGYEKKEVMNKSIFQFPILSKKDQKEAIKKISQRFSGKDVAPFELKFKTKNGEIKFGRVTGALVNVQAKKEPAELVMISDITTEKETELKVKELNELRSKFISVVSHQLRTPMASIRWNLEALLSGEAGKLKGDQENFIRLTYEAEKNVVNRLDALITVMNIEEGREQMIKETVSIENLLNFVLGVYKKECEVKQLDCVYKAPEKSLPPFFIDSEKTKKVFSALLSNAVNYTKEKGKITTKLELLEGGRGIRFEVSDTGIGIPKTEQKNIFNRFFRASNASSMVQDSSGLDLFIAKYYIEEQGGKISFESEESSGSTFWVELPLSSQSGLN